MITYCKKCLYPSNHPLGLTFNDDGVCSGCEIHQEKDQLDWAPREEKLRTILENYRCVDGSRHDCVVPVSGARDSFFIVDLLRNKYGLNPLLVAVNREYNTAAGVSNLEVLRTKIGCDIVTLTMNPGHYKKLIKSSLKIMGSVHWPYLAASTVFPVQVATKRKIPLIVWGAHQGIDQVGMFSHLDEVEMTRRYRKEHDLMGVEPENLMDLDRDIEFEDIQALFYPSDLDISQVGVRGIYLNNFIRWDTKAQHEAMLPKYGYNTFELGRTFDFYNDIDCRIYNRLHDEIKWRKWGYAKVVDQACREIRLNRINRNQAQKLVHDYLNKDAEGVIEFCHWLGIEEAELWEQVDAHRDPNVWLKNEDRWTLLIDPPWKDGEGEIVGSDFRFQTNELNHMVADKMDERLLMQGDIQRKEWVRP